MNRSKTLLLAVAVALPLGLSAEYAGGPDSYAAGTTAMNERRWADAVAAFDQVSDTRDKRADAALYWKAYSLGKLGKVELATDTCRKLKAQFAGSPWNKDCTALRLSTPDWQRAEDSADDFHFDFHFDQDYTTGSHSKDPNADLKILALNSLANRDPATAMPILRDILTGNQSSDLKRHALFVLAQNHSPEAQSLLRDLVLGKQGPALQRQAIQASGVYLGKHGNDTLLEAYRTTPDLQVKRAVISALFVSNDDVHMVELARAEKSVEIKRNIVSQLSLMHGKAANDYMLELLK